jgi:N-acetylneuraminic acid mutarotase
MHKCLFLFILIFTGFCSCSKDYPLEPITNWTHLSDFPGTPRASATGFVSGDKAYVCLGRSGSYSGFLKDLWEYDSSSNTWAQKSDFPGAARVKAVGAVIGNKAYVGMGSIGPYEGSSQFSDFWEYDIQTDRWTQKASFPGKGTNDLFCAVVDSCLYTTEGYTGTERVKDTYRYDPRTDVWIKMADCPIYHSGTAGFGIGSCFYVGTGFRGRNYKDFYCFQTLTGSWSRVADLPEGRILSSGMAINGKGYILLGRYWAGSLNGGRLLDDIVEYDPAGNSWIKRGNFPGGARQNAVVWSINGKGYILTGEDDSACKSDVWMFEP